MSKKPSGCEHCAELQRQLDTAHRVLREQDAERIRLQARLMAQGATLDDAAIRLKALSGDLRKAVKQTIPGGGNVKAA